MLNQAFALKVIFSTVLASTDTRIQSYLAKQEDQEEKSALDFVNSLGELFCEKLSSSVQMEDQIIDRVMRGFELFQEQGYHLGDRATAERMIDEVSQNLSSDFIDLFTVKQESENPAYGVVKRSALPRVIRLEDFVNANISAFIRCFFVLEKSYQLTNILNLLQFEIRDFEVTDQEVIVPDRQHQIHLKDYPYLEAWPVRDHMVYLVAGYLTAMKLTSGRCTQEEMVHLIDNAITEILLDFL